MVRVSGKTHHLMVMCVGFVKDAEEEDRDNDENVEILTQGRGI